MWIPVNERLPEKEGMYLVKWFPITKDQGYEMYSKMVSGDFRECEYSDDRAVFLSGAYEDGYIQSLFFDQKERCFVENLGNGEEYNVNRCIEYWMSLSELYEAEGGER